MEKETSLAVEQEDEEKLDAISQPKQESSSIHLRSDRQPPYRYNAQQMTAINKLYVKYDKANLEPPSELDPLYVKNRPNNLSDIKIEELKKLQSRKTQPRHGQETNNSGTRSFTDVELKPGGRFPGSNVKGIKSGQSLDQTKKEDQDKANRKRKTEQSDNAKERHKDGKEFKEKSKKESERKKDGYEIDGEHIVGKQSGRRSHHEPNWDMEWDKDHSFAEDKSNHQIANPNERFLVPFFSKGGGGVNVTNETGSRPLLPFFGNVNNDVELYEEDNAADIPKLLDPLHNVVKEIESNLDEDVEDYDDSFVDSMFARVDALDRVDTDVVPSGSRFLRLFGEREPENNILDNLMNAKQNGVNNSNQSRSHQGGGFSFEAFAQSVTQAHGYVPPPPISPVNHIPSTALFEEDTLHHNQPQTSIQERSPIPNQTPDLREASSTLMALLGVGSKNEANNVETLRLHSVHERSPNGNGSLPFPQKIQPQPQTIQNTQQILVSEHQENHHIMDNPLEKLIVARQGSYQQQQNALDNPIENLIAVHQGSYHQPPHTTHNPLEHLIVAHQENQQQHEPVDNPLQKLMVAHQDNAEDFDSGKNDLAKWFSGLNIPQVSSAPPPLSGKVISLDELE